MAQAEQVAKFGPRNFLYIENNPDAMLPINIGMVNGETRPGPRSFSSSVCSVVVSNPPIPEPMMTPISSQFSLLRSRPESSKAWWPA